MVNESEKYIYLKVMMILKRLLTDIGFKNFSRWDHNIVDHGKYDDHSQAYLPHMDKKKGTLISLNLECEK